MLELKTEEEEILRRLLNGFISCRVSDKNITETDSVSVDLLARVASVCVKEGTMSFTSPEYGTLKEVIIKWLFKELEVDINSIPDYDLLVEDKDSPEKSKWVMGYGTNREGTVLKKLLDRYGKIEFKITYPIYKKDG